MQILPLQHQLDTCILHMKVISVVFSVNPYTLVSPSSVRNEDKCGINGNSCCNNGDITNTSPMDAADNGKLNEMVRLSTKTSNKNVDITE